MAAPQNSRSGSSSLSTAKRAVLVSELLSWIICGSGCRGRFPRGEAQSHTRVFVLLFGSLARPVSAPLRLRPGPGRLSER
ncbi:hypothetical protein AOLI_G00055580 [Acnodon oligacanthus]